MIGLLVGAIIVVLTIWMSTNKCIVLQQKCGAAKLAFCAEWRENGYNGKPEWPTDIKSCRVKEGGRIEEIKCDQPTQSECEEFFE